MLVPLPYMLASLAFHHQFPQHLIMEPLRKSLLEPIANESAHLLKVDHLSCSALLLASSTLLLIGLKGKISGPPTILDRRKHSASKKEKGVTGGVRRIMERAIGVGLPFYATMNLGSDRVALVMLVALAADITNVEDETTDLISIKGWKRLLIHRKWTLASIALQILGDFLGLSASTSSLELIVGYSALLVSIFFVSPPFPSLKAKASPPTSFSSSSPTSTPKLLRTHWENRPWAKPVPDAHGAISQLVCTPEDINLTLAAGTALCVLSCIYFFILKPGAGTAINMIDPGLGFLSAFAAAVSYQFVQPHTIRKNSGIGLLLGSMTSLGLMMLMRAHTWGSIAYQGICIGVTFSATKLDTLQFHSTSHTQHQSHHLSHHGHDNAADPNLPSRFSRFILDWSRKWPLLHSILVEKDSRRIFYFMWWVLTEKTLALPVNKGAVSTLLSCSFKHSTA